MADERGSWLPGTAKVLLADASASLSRGEAIERGLVQRLVRLPAAQVRFTISDLFRHVALMDVDGQDAAAGAVVDLVRQTEARVEPDIDDLVSILIELPAGATPTRRHLLELLRERNPYRLHAAIDRHVQTQPAWRIEQVRAELLPRLAMAADDSGSDAGGWGSRGGSFGLDASEDGHAEPMAADGGPHAEPPDAVAADGGHDAESPAAEDGGPVAAATGDRESTHTGGPRAAGHRAYGLLSAPDEAVVGTPFELEVGLTKRRPAGVTGGRLRLPALERAPFFVDVQLVADTFDLAAGETFSQRLPVSKASPYPSVTLHLTPRKQRAPRTTRQITATFGVDGETVGVAMRTIDVANEGAPRARRSRPAVVAITAGTPSGGKKADLTIEISLGDQAGALRWKVRSPHPGVQSHADSAVRQKVVQGSPEAFARYARDQIEGSDGTEIIGLTLLGLGRAVSRAIPEPIMGAIRRVAKVNPGQPPDILILSQEPYIPWELAVIDPPILPGAPPFLGAQANVGRWLLGTPPPAADPPRRVRMASMAVIEGSYKGPLSTFGALPGAAREIKELRRQYQASKVDPTYPSIVALLRGDPAADVIHFAAHGQVADEGDDGLILATSTGRTVVLSPSAVEGANLPSQPFVFLNACQVGAARQTLASYSGLAAGFVRSGASAVVAPIWAIDDEVSHDVALGIYKDAYGSSDSPPIAAMLRLARAGFDPNGTSTNATVVAYQFYGHPSMRLER